MSKVLATKNVAAVVLALALIVGFAFAFATPAKADTLSVLQAQVQALLAQISALQGGSSSSMSSAACHTFTMSAKKGSKGGEVMWIQQFLNSSADTVVSASGAGSKGNETSTFGPATAAAVTKFQEKYSADILAPVGLTKGSGNWGPSTRAKANSLCAVTGPVTGPVVPKGPGITISAGVQPANSLAPKSALRVPFTNITLTNNSGDAVTITGVQVLRTGLAADTDFASIVLVDSSSGLQVSSTQTLDSNHSAVIGGTWTLAAGASRSFTVSGNIAASPNAGEVPSLSVTGVNTTAPVSASFPIVGASQTINTTLVIGSVTTAISSYDPNSASTKTIGSTAVKFTGVRFTAGSTEDLKLNSIRWRIAGSASPNDLGNMATVVAGTGGGTYPTVTSADGRYYTTTFPGGLLIAKGYSTDLYIQGDLVGNNSSGRVAEFDIDKTSDVYFVGQLYGYGVALAYNSSGTVSTASTHATTYASSGNPVFQGSTVTIAAGTVTTIQNANSVASQNIAVNVPNQVLGGFITNFAGEPVTESGLKVNIGSTATTAVSEITNVSIVDQNGAVIAGPIDAVGSILNYTTSITFPVGARTYTLKGKIPSTGWPNNSTVQLSTTPSGWTSPTGQSTGNSITISQGVFTMNTMTVKAGSLAITAGAAPSSQNVVAGAQNVTMATIQFDASQSGEDVRMSSVPLRQTGTGYGANLSGCALWSGATQLNTGSNVVNTVTNSSFATAYNTFTFDNAVTFAKGGVTTLNLTCNLSSAATSSQTYIWGPGADTYAGTGAASGNTVTPTATAGNSGSMTVSSSATLTINIDASSPSYAVQAAGATGVAAGVIKVRAANEAFNLQKLGLTLANGTYGANSTGAGNSSSSGAGDIVTAYLYNGATLLGTATFTGVSQTATSTFSGTGLAVARDTDILITVKVDLAGISMSAAGGIGNLVKVDPNNYEGVGQLSGVTVRGNATTGVAGFRMFKSYPTIAADTLPTTGIADGRLMRFTVKANAAGPVGINQLVFTLSTSTITNVTNFQVFGFTDSAYSQTVSGQGTGGQIGSTLSPTSTSNLTISPTATVVQVPAGATYYFEVRGSVAGVVSGSSVVTKLLGDTAYPTGLTTGWNVATSSVASSTSNFVWAGNSTSTSGFFDIDWANGYSIPGLPSSGLIMTRSN